MKKLFEIPELLTLDGKKFTGDEADVLNPNMCKDGCQGGCDDGCNPGQGAYTPPPPPR